MSDGVECIFEPTKREGESRKWQNFHTRKKSCDNTICEPSNKVQFKTIKRKFYKNLNPGKKEWENIESTNRAVGACTSDLRRSRL